MFGEIDSTILLGFPQVIVINGCVLLLCNAAP